ncbi:putative disease resistance RPP8-like protein 4 [Abeliophyllum distichum]|uniref:Disease resistance RPP8-like protein 4 n=1 Tax=Abeliophyllum distichum TaxID=126358 RepID=A0ABD1RVC4_9LAMI
MAYASLLSLNQTLDQILHPHDQTEQPQIIRSLHEQVSFLLSFLDVSSPQNSDKLIGLEERIRDAAYEAEDIIDSSMSNQIVSESGSHEYRTESHISNQIVLEWDQKFEYLQKIIQELNSISDEVVKMRERNEIQVLLPSNSLPAASSKSRSTNKSATVGLARDLLEIKKLLTNSHSELEVVSIVGMGGIGKTTLAKLTYNDSLIANHFDVRAWVVVSREYREQEVLKGLLNSLRGLNHESGEESIEKLAENVSKFLKDKRYLIVIDDVWGMKQLNRVKSLFPDNNNGSRIILTTRISQVANRASLLCPPYHMSFRDEIESWSLLHEKMFGEERCPPELEEIGKMILMECRGLPLLLVLIGGLLYKSERTVYYWHYVLSNIRSKITDRDYRIRDSISFIYSQLPHHLRACFLYMGVLPEDYEIRKSKLTKLWVANRFIKPDRSKSLEEVAEEYLKDLVDRNLILVREWCYSGEIKTCSIHDILWDFCLMKSKEEKFNSDVEYLPRVHDNLRQVSIHTDLKNQIPRFALGNNRDLLVRSVTFFFRNSPNDVCFITNFRLLRVLDALTISFEEFPVEIVELVTLRCIALTYWMKHRFPASIAKLCNLETLIINPGKFRSIFNTSFLPLEIWKMSRLRHLLFVRSYLPYPTDALIGGTFVPLENLQTLSNVINFRWTKEILKMMPNLKKLVISFEHDGRTEWSSYCFDNFVHLHQLEVLKCFFFAKCYMKYQDPLSVSFAFPQKLKRLTLSGCRISWKNMSVVGSLSNLEVLKLKFHAFEGPVWELNDGEFRRLKLLLIHMTDLEHWKVNETHLPTLQRLSLRYCYKLVEIPSGIGKIPTLEEIELCECSTSLVTSAEFIQKEQESLGNKEFQVVLKSKDTDISS